MQSLRLLSNQGAVVPVRCEGNIVPTQQALIVEAERQVYGLAIENAVVLPPNDGITQMVVKNNTGSIYLEAR